MKKRCYGCMKLKNQSPVCEHCGYNENVPNYPHQLPIGTVLKGQYTVGKVLGQGGFGITYIGWDNSLETPVAIKEFYPNSFVTRESVFSLDVHCAGEGAEALFRQNRERFLKEAKILAKLQNVPGIVRVQNLFAENNTAYIIMEYVEGIDLKHYIRMQNRVLTVQEAFSVLRPVMYALSKVHEAELVHRDISPDNIMILPDGTAKLLDFGAAREVENAEVNKELPQSTEAILKHGFAPMEQYRRRGSLGPWTDVYALCATMYYCLTGRVPNSAPERIMGDDNVNWRQIPGLSEEQITTLERGLAIMPENRIRTMKELYSGLFGQTTVTQSAPKKAEAPAKPASYPTHTVSLEEEKPAEHVMVTKPKKKKKPVGILIAAVLAVAAIAAGAFFLKPGESNITVELPEILPAATEATETTEAVTLSAEELQYREAEALEAAGEYGKAAIAFGKLAGYEDARERSFALWDKVAKRDTVSAGFLDVAGIHTDGTLQTTGYRGTEGMDDLIAISIGRSVIGLRSDGTVLTTEYEDTELDPMQWQDIVAIDASYNTIVGLRCDGTVIAAGNNDHGQCDVGEWTDIIAVSAGSCTVGLRSDGTVVAVGDNSWGRRDVQTWTDIVAISANTYHTVGLRSDGTVVAVGENTYGKCNVQEWKDIIAISAGQMHTVGLRSDGTVVSVGSNAENQCQTGSMSDIVAISAGTQCTAALRSDGTVMVVGGNSYKLRYEVPTWTDIKLPAANAGAESKPTDTSTALTGHVLSPDWKTIVLSIPTYRPFESVAQIEYITFLDTLKDAPEKTWDVSEDGDGTVLAWAEPTNNNAQFHLYIAADGGVNAPENSKMLFGGIPMGMTGLLTINFNDAFYTGNVTNMDGMFRLADSLSGVDLSSFDTSQVTSMKEMFMGCGGMTSLDLRSFDTSKVTNMCRMFQNCSAMTLDVSSFDTSCVTDMNSMFMACFNLPILDISNFDTSHVTNMDEMFRHCYRLTDLDVGKFDTSSVTSWESFMDEGKTVNGQPWEKLFEAKVSQERHVLSQDWIDYILNSPTVFNKRSQIESITFLDTLENAPEKTWDVSEHQDGTVLAWAEKSRRDNTLFLLYIAAEGGVTAPEDSSYLFSSVPNQYKGDYVNLVTIYFNDAFYTDQVISMDSMFINCKGLISLDLSCFDTSKVTNMSMMFSGCRKLASLNLSSFDTSRVTDMSYMFVFCNVLEKLDISNFDTSRVTTMRGMFLDCCELNSLDIQNFDTSKVTNMCEMFSACPKLNLTPGKFDTSSVENYENFMNDGMLVNGRPWEELFEN